MIKYTNLVYRHQVYRFVLTFTWGTSTFHENRTQDDMSTSITPTQLGLELFREANGLPITEFVSKEVGFKKNNYIINLAGNYGLLGHRIINACMYIAKPSVLETPEFIVDLDYFKWLASYESNNISHLRAEFSKVRQSAFKVDFLDTPKDNADGGEVSLITKFLIRGNKVMFALEPSLRKAIAIPDQFTFISLRITNRFSSEYASRLYERLRAMKYRGDSGWMTVEQFRVITNTTEQKAYDEYKSLRRRVIDPAITQINAVSDIYVKLHTRRGDGGFISELRFEISDNENCDLNQVLDEAFPPALYTTLRKEFQLDDSTISELNQKYTAAAVLEKVEFARYRIANRSPGEQEIKYPGKYLLSIIDKDLALTEKEKRRSAPKKVPVPDIGQDAVPGEATNPEIQATQTKAQGLLDSMSDADRAEALRLFAESGLFRAIKRTRRKADPSNLDDPMVRSAFNEFLASTQS